MTIAVIGAGLQGCLTAIELAGRGHEVVVFERATQPLTGASRWNEGKIHLGYLFANDPSLRSARTMIAGATTFAPLLSRYLGHDAGFVESSDAFVYAVHRDSLLSRDEVAAHLDRVHSLVAEALATTGTSYLGAPELAPPRAAPVAERGLDDANVVAAFDTEERSIDARQLTEAVAARIGAEPLVGLRPATAVTAIERRDDGRFDLTDSSMATHGPFEQVVNCAWERRLALDATMGYRPASSWLHRYKLALHVDIGERHRRVPSVTVVLGPFGDVVNFGGSGRLYLSWYDLGRIASSVELIPPAIDELADAARLEGMPDAMLRSLTDIVPGLAGLELTRDNSQLKGGYIFAWGMTDIDDRRSGLHNRYDIGVHSDRGYHSIDTGKLTMAPLNAATVGARVGDAARARPRSAPVEAVRRG
jgi:glycine/D-amino acid oxidase-like deaminating enzyme